MIRYVFRDENVILKNAAKADPQKIGEALAKITAQNHGRLTPQAVVDAAKSPRHPLHQHFEWDDKAAAEAYRLDQARNVIRIVRVEDDETQETKPAFISVADDGRAYRTVQEVESSGDLQLAVLRQAERDLAAFQKRYRALRDICSEIDTIRGKLAQKRANLETRAAA